MNWACLDIKVQIKNLFQCLKNSWPQHSSGLKKQQQQQAPLFLQWLQLRMRGFILKKKKKNKSKANSSIIGLRLDGFLAKSARKVIC